MSCLCNFLFQNYSRCAPYQAGSPKLNYLRNHYVQRDPAHTVLLFSGMGSLLLYELMRVALQLSLVRKLIALWLLQGANCLKTEIFRLDFRNPVGLGAGFDKNARYLRDWTRWVSGLWRSERSLPWHKPGMINHDCSGFRKTRR